MSSLWLTLGGVFFKKKNLLAFAYAFETERKFDVSIRQDGRSFNQKDEQGMLKYGLGLEAKIWRGLHVRATAGGCGWTSAIWPRTSRWTTNGILRRGPCGSLIYGVGSSQKKTRSAGDG